MVKDTHGMIQEPLTKLEVNYKELFTPLAH